MIASPDQRTKKGLMALTNEGHEVFTPTDLIKDPYVLEFTGRYQTCLPIEKELTDELKRERAQIERELKLQQKTKNSEI